MILNLGGKDAMSPKAAEFVLDAIPSGDDDLK